MSGGATKTSGKGVHNRLPLTVLLFDAAMREEITISDFAKQLDIGPVSLRQFLYGETERPRNRTLETFADTLDMSFEEAQDRLKHLPPSMPSFSTWLNEHIQAQNISRARLNRDTLISDGALRNYLSGQTLPDSHQAMRIAKALGVPSLEVAQVIIADQTLRSGGQTAPPPPDPELEAAAHAAVDPIAGRVSADPAFADVYASDQPAVPVNSDEHHLLSLWRRMHPQGRRATLIYIAGLLVES
jgi:transcriptional regulator with XRE-family HTH domain